MRSWMRDSLRRPSPAEEFEREVLSWLGEVVDVPQAAGAWAISGWHNEGPVYEAVRGDRALGVEEGVRRLRERFGDERLRVLAAEAFFDARSIGRDHRYREYEWRAI